MSDRKADLLSGPVIGVGASAPRNVDESPFARPEIMYGYPLDKRELDVVKAALRRYERASAQEGCR